ncbi:MAG TPA: ELWxxDGT repeat protein [Thermoanaerobaculia bacterium]|nr:ELWxxDGT repeat protein [Thermoanaerobaculia bacterium]
MGWGAGESQAQPAYRVKDINTAVPRASSAGSMTPLAVVGDNVFFAGDDGANGLELWKVDTLTGSATMVKDIFPGQGSSLHSLLMTTANGLVFFAAYDGVHGGELWKSDGTTAGTVMIRDLDPSPNTFAIGRWIASAGGLVFFGGNDGSSGEEVWVTDGTSAGTKLLADIRPGSQGSNTAFLATAGGKVLFAADDGTHGLEPWISDGTGAGTRMFQDIAPGALSSFPERMTGASARIYFLADNGTGTELWAFPAKALNPTFTDVPASYWAAAWIEQLAAEGITTGCAPGQYCPGGSVSRDQMAAFLTRTFNLAIP